jgi:hypothetical protein
MNKMTPAYAKALHAAGHPVPQDGDASTVTARMATSNLWAQPGVNGQPRAY